MNFTDSTGQIIQPGWTATSTAYTAATHCRSNYYTDTGRKQHRGDREIRCGLPPHGSGDHTEFDHEGAELVSWPPRHPAEPTSEDILWDWRGSSPKLEAEVVRLRAEIAEAETRGFQRAIEALRDADRYRDWYDGELNATGRDLGPVRPGDRRQLAAYLEAIAVEDRAVAATPWATPSIPAEPQPGDVLMVPRGIVIVGDRPDTPPEDGP